MAIELTDKANKAFKTKAVAIGDLAKVTPLSIASGKAHYVQSPLEDKTNENSCILSSFEVEVVKERDANRLSLIN